MTRWILGLVVIARVAHAQGTDGAKLRAAELFERGRLDVVQRADFATACELFAQSYGLDSAPGTALNLGDCNEHLGHIAAAVHWFEEAEQAFAAVHDSEREAFAHSRAEALRAQIPEAAPVAQPRTGWRVTFWAAAATTAAGLVTYAVGANQMQDATNKLCAGGAYDGVMPNCPVPANPLTPSQVATLNQQGMRGRDIANIGIGTAFIAGAVAAVSLYEGYLRADPKRAHDVVIAPTFGGAVVMGRF